MSPSARRADGSEVTVTQHLAAHDIVISSQQQTILKQFTTSSLTKLPNDLEDHTRTDQNLDLEARRDSVDSSTGSSEMLPWSLKAGEDEESHVQVATKNQKPEPQKEGKKRLADALNGKSRLKCPYNASRGNICDSQSDLTRKIDKCTVTNLSKVTESSPVEESCNLIFENNCVRFENSHNHSSKDVNSCSHNSTNNAQANQEHKPSGVLVSEESAKILSGPAQESFNKDSESTSFTKSTADGPTRAEESKSAGNFQDSCSAPTVNQKPDFSSTSWSLKSNLGTRNSDPETSSQQSLYYNVQYPLNRDDLKFIDEEDDVPVDEIEPNASDISKIGQQRRSSFPLVSPLSLENDFQDLSVLQRWTCVACTFANDISCAICTACETSHVFDENERPCKSNGDSALLEKQNVKRKMERPRSVAVVEHWTCPLCTLQNPLYSTRCQACQWDKNKDIKVS